MEYLELPEHLLVEYPFLRPPTPTEPTDTGQVVSNSRELSYFQQCYEDMERNPDLDKEYIMIRNWSPEDGVRWLARHAQKMKARKQADREEARQRAREEKEERVARRLEQKALTSRRDDFDYHPGHDPEPRKKRPYKRRQVREESVSPQEEPKKRGPKSLKAHGEPAKKIPKVEKTMELSATTKRQKALLLLKKEAQKTDAIRIQKEHEEIVAKKKTTATSRKLRSQADTTPAKKVQKPEAIRKPKKIAAMSGESSPEFNVPKAEPSGSAPVAAPEDPLVAVSDKSKPTSLEELQILEIPDAHEIVATLDAVLEAVSREAETDTEHLCQSAILAASEVQSTSERTSEASEDPEDQVKATLADIIDALPVDQKLPTKEHAKPDVTPEESTTATPHLEAQPVATPFQFHQLPKIRFKKPSMSEMDSEEPGTSTTAPVDLPEESTHKRHKKKHKKRKHRERHSEATQPEVAPENPQFPTTFITAGGYRVTEETPIRFQKVPKMPDDNWPISPPVPQIRIRFNFSEEYLEDRIHDHGDQNHKKTKKKKKNRHHPTDDTASHQPDHHAETPKSAPKPKYVPKKMYFCPECHEESRKGTCLCSGCGEWVHLKCARITAKQWNSDFRCGTCSGSIGSASCSSSGSSTSSWYT